MLLNRGSTEPLVFDGAVSGVRWKSFNIPTLSGAVGHLISGGKLDVGRRSDLFFWSSPDFERKIGRHAARFYGSVETATKLLGFGRLARVKKHCIRRLAIC